MALSVVQLTDFQSADPGHGTLQVSSDIEGMALTARGPGRNRIFLRGIADSPFNGESQSTVAVLLDDARITYAAPDPDIRLVDVSRVEVLKGPQGSLYGIGALGGIYHIVTNRAELDETSLTVSAGTETVSSGKTGISASAVANLPIVPGAAAIRLVGYSAKEPGWIETGHRNNSNSGRVLGARAGLGVDMGHDWRVDVTGFAQWLESRDTQYVYESRSRERPDQLSEPHDNDLRHISARIARPSGGLDIVLSSAFTWHEVAGTLDATIGADSFGLADPQLLKDMRNYRVWDNEARLSGKMGSLSWLLGLSHVEAKQTVRWTLYGASPDTSLTIDDDRRMATDSAAFGEVALPLTGRLELTAGARLFHSNIRETRALSTGSVTRESSRNGVTPSAALSWQPRPGRLVFVRYGSAIRQGGSDIGASGQLEMLKSDELATIEAGWREILPGGGRLDLGAYFTWWNDVQSDLLQSDGLIETENAGDARIVGSEVSLDWPLASSWRLQAGATYVRAKLVRNTLGFELNDQHLPVVPEYALRGAVRHDFSLWQANAWIRLQLRYIGPARLSFDPELDRPMGHVLESRIEGHLLTDGFDFALTINNPLGRKSDVFAFGNSLRFATMRQHTPQQPARILLSVMKPF